jgi:hypothetical protein
VDPILRKNPPQKGTAPDASLCVTFTLKPGQEMTIRLTMAWYAPESDRGRGKDPENAANGMHVT